MNQSLSSATDNTATNTSAKFRYQWSFIPALEAISFPCVVLLNGGILALFIINKRFNIPFNIYLSSVLVSNIFFAVLDNPLDILNFISPYWWLGDPLCSLYLYALNIPSGIVMYSHVLITINRIWAVTFPHAYRRHHSVQIAVCMVAAVWMYVHIVYLPGVVMDAVWYRLPIETSGCLLNIDKMAAWNTTAQFMTFALPNVVIIGAYPYLLYMRREYRRVKILNRALSLRSSGHRVTSSTGQRAKLTRPGESGNNSFTVVTVLTLSIILCWTPLVVFYTVWCFVDLSSYTVTLEFCQGVFVLQPALDPVFFAGIMPGIRSDIMAFLRKFQLLFCTC
ncbi:5-hydroxytryptamine receptor 1D-like [Paramacrobiotus metropolitanus]|uniref:5-hydroxytryptamine receptor 1D-like n=1 Tax=Paramacrobiotus metropolitanus TaxID=2943436 RepID=UPI002445F274|nr:5-hydroxytryptamine receptor 1D-like [Paramacrobiotus metropolitanus]